MAVPGTCHDTSGGRPGARQGREGCPASSHLLEDHGECSEIETETSELRGDERTEDADLAQLGDECGRIASCCLVIVDDRDDLLVHQLANSENDLAPLIRLALPRGQRPAALP